VHALRAGTAGLDEELAALADTHRSRHHPRVSFGIGGQPRPLPPEATVALIRTAQEALVNTAKHAPGQPVDIGLHYGEDEVQMIISNPLPPGSHNSPGPGAAFGTVNGGYGLTGMRERLLLIGGSLTAAPGDGRWTVTAQVPR
jgi:signal transduction histidine kinase